MKCSTINCKEKFVGEHITRLYSQQETYHMLGADHLSVQ